MDFMETIVLIIGYRDIYTINFKVWLGQQYWI